jgi:DNA-binding transcriptional MerR regulator
VPNRQADSPAAARAPAGRRRQAQAQATLPLGIAETCTRVGMTLRAIRHYESLGLLLPRRIGGARVYGAAELRTLQLLQRFKALGFTLKECRSGLQWFGQPTSGPPTDSGTGLQALVELLQNRRDAVDSMLAELRVIRDAASAALATGERC